MSVTPAPAVVSVPYESPHLRALGSAQRAALAGLASSVLIAIIPAVLEFIQHQDFSVTALKTLGSGVAFTALSTLYVYLQKRSEASNEPVVPVPPAAPAITPGEVGTIGQAVALPALPLLDAGLLVQLVERTLRDSLASAAPVAPEPPPATISHRVITGTGEGVVLGADAAVKRSHHAAKAPAVTSSGVTTADS